MYLDKYIYSLYSVYKKELSIRYNIFLALPEIRNWAIII